MQISVSGPLAAILAREGVHVPGVINFDDGAFANAVEEHRKTYPALAEESLEFLAKIDAGHAVEQEIAIRRAAADARVEEQRKLEETMQTVVSEEDRP